MMAGMIQGRLARAVLTGLVAGAFVLQAEAGLAQARPGEKAAPQTPAQAGPPAPKLTGKPQLDELFGRLAAAKDEEEAKGIAGLIERRFERSGSDTADLLMSRSGQVLRDDPALAVELLDRVMQLTPDWAEAFSRRALAFYRLDDPGRAMMDLREALAREPRHFQAWTALGHVELASGDKARALYAYRKALKLYPLLSEAKRMADRLAPEIDGRDI